MAEKKPIITLLTDFGVQDYFVGAMKGAILTTYPQVEIVDIAHNIMAHDIFQAAFLLKNYYRCFPSGSIHVVVVDPGLALPASNPGGIGKAACLSLPIMGC